MEVLELLAAFSSSRKDLYHTALTQIRVLPLAEKSWNLASEVAAEMVRRGEISDREQANRFSALLGILELPQKDLQAFAKASASLPKHLKNAIALNLPVEFRPLLNEKQGATSHAVDIATTTNLAPLILDATIEPIRPNVVIESNEELSTVFIISKVDNQTFDRNRSLLRVRGFSAIRFGSFDQLLVSLENSWDVAGCIIDQSFLSSLNADEQKKLFSDIARFSSFMWIRIQEEGLQIDNLTIQDIVKKARCQHAAISVNQLSIQKGGEVTAFEISSLELSRTLLHTEETARFVPEELDPSERKLLLASARQYASETRPHAQVAISTLPTRFMTGGRSGTKIALIRVEQQRVPVVAKIGAKSQILDEIERFNAFIIDWDNNLAPRVYLHGHYGVIIFDLIRGEASSISPAPHLESRLETFWIDELFLPEPPNKVSETNLVAGLANISNVLLTLNQRPCPDRTFPSYANPDISRIEKLESRSVRWEFPSSAFEARTKALVRFQRLGQAAVVHGDIQLRNILVRGDRDVHLIDYAGSGPGHPAIDLVRFELMLFLKCFKQKQHEERCEEFQVDLSLNLFDAETLKTKFPVLLASSINSICMQGCVSARDHAIKAVEAHGGDRDDYLATKYLAAWQYLAIDGFQNGLARSVISGLADFVKNLDP